MLRIIHFFLFAALFGILLGATFFALPTVILLPNLDPDTLKGGVRLQERTRTPCPPNNPHCQPDPTATKKPPDPPTATRELPDSPTETSNVPDPPTSPPDSVNRAATKTALAALGVIVPTETSTDTPGSDPSTPIVLEATSTPSPVIYTTEVTVVVSSTPVVSETSRPTIVPFAVVLVAVLAMIYVFTRTHQN